MKLRLILSTVLAACPLFTNVRAGESASASPADPYANETPAQRDARMKWWREARFGMFIHWGVYAVPAGVWNGTHVTRSGAEWIMNRGKIPVADYRKFAREFNPVKYDADEWVRLAQEAGMKYIVITSKHHDGFALFDSKASDWNVVQATPYGQDLLQPLADACRKHGVKLGYYYSQAQDWNNGGSASGGKWDKAQERSMDDYIDKVAVPQVREILTRYGEFPSVLWWDTPTDMNRQRAEKLLPLLKLKPGIIHNNRLVRGEMTAGDFETPEQKIPATGIPGKDWETCMTINGTWGFRSYDTNWKSTEMLIRNLVDIASKGGNYLLNVGPTAEGLIPGPSVERLREIGRWMKGNSESIYATTASPFQRLPWGRCTKKVTAEGATLYLHVFDWPKDGRLLVPGLKSTVEKAYLLADAKQQPLAATSSADGVTITIPTAAPDPIASTLVLKIKGKLDVQQPVATAAEPGPAQDPDGSLQLPASKALLHGAKIKYESGSGRNSIGFWTDPNDWAEWEFSLAQPGKFAIAAECAARSGSAFEIVLGDQKLNASVTATGDYAKFQRTEVGTVVIPAGKARLIIRPVKAGWKPINLRSVVLKPAT